MKRAEAHAAAALAAQRLGVLLARFTEHIEALEAKTVVPATHTAGLPMVEERSGYVSRMVTRPDGVVLKWTWHLNTAEEDANGLMARPPMEEFTPEPEGPEDVRSPAVVPQRRSRHPSPASHAAGKRKRMDTPEVYQSIETDEAGEGSGLPGRKRLNLK